jgi:hypothetical protein
MPDGADESFHFGLHQQLHHCLGNAAQEIPDLMATYASNVTASKFPPRPAER